MSFPSPFDVICKDFKPKSFGFHFLNPIGFSFPSGGEVENCPQLAHEEAHVLRSDQVASNL